MEWRALTVSALDFIVEELRKRLHVDAATFPLVKVWQLVVCQDCLVCESFPTAVACMSCCVFVCGARCWRAAHGRQAVL